MKLDVLHKGETRTLTLALGEMPNDRQANAGEQHSGEVAGTPRLGLQLAPAAEVDGSGNKGVVVTAVAFAVSTATRTESVDVLEVTLWAPAGATAATART